MKAYLFKAILCMAVFCYCHAVNKTANAQNFNDSTLNFYSITTYYDAYFDSLIQVRGSENMRGTGYKDYIRWKHFYFPRHSSDGDLSSIWNGINDYFDSLQEPQLSDGSDWRFLGPTGIPPGPEGEESSSTGKGMMISIWVDPCDRQNILAGGHHGGLWKTTDGGDHWFPLHDMDSRIHGVNSIAVDPHDQDIIFITGTNTLADVSSYSAGVFRSVDAGETWEALNNFEGVNYPSGNRNEEVRKLFFPPKNHDTLFFLNARALFMSTDEGDNWEQLFHKNYCWYDGSDSGSFFQHNGMFDIATSTLNDSVLFLAGSEVFQITLNPDASADSINISEGVFLAGMNPNDRLIRPPFCCTISVDNHFPGMIWFCYIADYMINETDSVSLFRVIRFSETDSLFSFIYQGSSILMAPGFSPGKMVFSVSPGNDSTFYLGGTLITELLIQPGMDSLFVIGGSAYPDSSFIHVDMRAMQVFSDGNGHDTLFIANDGGIAWGTSFPEEKKPSDNFWQWIQACGSASNGLDVTEFYGFGISDSKPDFLAGGCQDLSNMLLSEGKWANFGDGDGGEVVFDPENPDIFYFFEFQYGNYYRTNDRGVHYDYFYKPASDIHYVMTPMTLDPFDQSILIGGSLGKLMKFTGVNHFPDAPGVDTLHNFTDYISDIEVIDRGNNNRRYYVSSAKAYHSYSDPPPVTDSLVGCIFRSDQNNASMFSDISRGLAGCIDGFVCDIETDPNDIDRLWVGCALFSKTPDQVDKVYYSEDGGDHWQNYSDGLPDGMPVYKIKYVPSINTLFAATDVGIFKRSPGSEHWTPFNDDLPRKIITDLEVNIPYNKIIASTYGRGMWESSLDCPFNDSTLIISASTTWDEDLFLDREVFIDSGVVLTIKNCTVSLPSNKKIIVSCGARLYIDSAKLSTYCRTPWGGIEAWGNPKYSQLEEEHFGYVEITGGSVIENAITGLRTGRADPYDHFFEEYNGGIVRILSSTFRNNQTAIEFLPFYNFHPVYEYELRYCGNIYNSEFITDRDLLDSRSFKEFVKMTQVNGIDIRGCGFSNQRSSKIDYPERGKGIYSLGAQFYVDDFCLDPNISPCEELRSCSFEGLQYGIKALATGSDKTVKINDAYFTSNLTGIYLSAVNEATVTLNYFEVLKADSSNADNYCGLYLDYCTGYTVEENFFTSDTNHRGASANSFGLVVKDSGEDYNEIYNNSFNYLDFGIEALNHNRSAIEYKGLVIKCNDFNDGVVNNIVVTKDSTASWINGIAKYQGSDEDETSPAGNLFNHNETPGLFHYDNLELAHIIYSMHTPSSNIRVQPLIYTDTTITLDTTNYYYSKSSACPPNYSGSHPDTIIDKINTSGDQIILAQAELTAWTDGGNTEELVADVSYSIPPEAYEIYSELLLSSPYLSDTVMKEAIRKETVLNNEMIQDVLSANPQSAKSVEIDQALNERNNPLTQGQRDSIHDGKHFVSLKERLEARLANWEHRRALSLSDLICYYKLDTLNSGSTDSLLSTLSNENSPESLSQFVFVKLSNGDTLSVSTTINQISTFFNLNNWQQSLQVDLANYIGIISGYYTPGESILSIDSVSINDLSLLVPNETYTGAYARNILRYLDIFNLEEPYVIPNNMLKSSITKKPPSYYKFTKENDWFNLYPNPARSYFVITYNSINSDSQGQLRLFDANGKLKLISELTGNNKHQIISTNELCSGIYLCEFLSGDKIVKTEKLIVIH